MKKPIFCKRILQKRKAGSLRKKKKKAKRPVMFQAIVISKRKVEAKQPNSAQRKCIKIKRKKDEKILYAFCPGDGAIDYIEEHDEVLISGVGTKNGRPKGDIPAISWQVSKINGVCLFSLLKNKREPRRK